MRNLYFCYLCFNYNHSAPQTISSYNKLQLQATTLQCYSGEFANSENNYYTLCVVHERYDIIIIYFLLYIV